MNKLFNSFLFLLSLLIISPPPANTSENEPVRLDNPVVSKTPLIVIVTDELIHNICYQTGDFNLCHHILHQFKGKTLFPKPLAKVMWHMRGHTKTTAKKIVRAYDGIKDQHRSYALTEAYRKCLADYTRAMNFLAEADKFIQKAKIKPAFALATNATSAIRSCDQELGGQWHDGSGLSHDNKKIFDLNGMFLVMCGTLKKNLRIG